eukprot:m.432731 g.432731  ORF g.432731 m.432731 type:complete len:508 (+) comp17483_c0_seq1:114-1637(+)
MSASRGASELERVRFAFAQMVGKTVQVQTMNGVVYEGILSGTNVGSSPTAQIGVSLEMAYKKSDAKVDSPFVGPPAKASRDALIEKLVINDEDVAQIFVAGLDLAFRAAPPEGIDGFTDTGISGGYGAVKTRTLEQWQPSADEIALGDIGDLSSSSAAGFDAEEMFATAKRNHNYQSTFNEDEYTTQINKSHPDYARRMQKAALIERSILGGGGGRHSSNVHVQEDRGMLTNVNEESKYGAVKDGKYRAPAFRPPVGLRAPDGADGGSATKKEKPRVDPAAERERVNERLKSFSKDFHLDKTAEETQPSTQSPPTSSAAPSSEAKEEEKKDFKFNVDAKEFKLNVGAKEFKPVSASPRAPPPNWQQPGVPPQMMVPHMGVPMMQSMPSGLPQVMPRGMPQPMSQFYPQHQVRPMYVYRMPGQSGVQTMHPVVMQQQMMGSAGGQRMPLQHHVPMGDMMNMHPPGMIPQMVGPRGVSPLPAQGQNSPASMNGAGPGDSGGQQGPPTSE